MPPQCPICGTNHDTTGCPTFSQTEKWEGPFDITGNAQCYLSYASGINDQQADQIINLLTKILETLRAPKTITLPPQHQPLENEKELEKINGD